MKTLAMMFWPLACWLTVAGCENPQRLPEGPAANAWLASSADNQQIANAIIREHTLYPYQFEADGAKLNELGARDIQVLIEHFRHAGGTLSIRRLDSPVELYRARVKEISDMLAAAGIARERVKIVDAMPGGQGMPSPDVVLMLQPKGTVTESSYAAQTTTIKQGDYKP